MSRAPKWTPEEDRVIEAHYPVGGMTACRARLPGRSDTAIYNRASQLGRPAPQTRTVLAFGAAVTHRQYAPSGVDEVMRAWGARRNGGAA